MPTEAVKGAWSPPSHAGGCPQHTSWRANPTYSLEASEAAVFTLSLRQPPSRAMAAIGFVVLHGVPEPPGPSTPLQASELIGKSRWKASPEQTIQLELTGGQRCVVVPSTFAPGEVGEFTLEVSADTPFALKDVSPAVAVTDEPSPPLAPTPPPQRRARPC